MSGLGSADVFCEGGTWGRFWFLRRLGDGGRLGWACRGWREFKIVSDGARKIRKEKTSHDSFPCGWVVIWSVGCHLAGGLSFGRQVVCRLACLFVIWSAGLAFDLLVCRFIRWVGIWPGISSFGPPCCRLGRLAVVWPFSLSLSSFEGWELD